MASGWCPEPVGPHWASGSVPLSPWWGKGSPTPSPSVRPGRTNQTVRLPTVVSISHQPKLVSPNQALPLLHTAPLLGALALGSPGVLLPGSAHSVHATGAALCLCAAMLPTASASRLSAPTCEQAGWSPALAPAGPSASGPPSTANLIPGQWLW